MKQMLNKLQLFSLIVIVLCMSVSCTNDQDITRVFDTNINDVCNIQSRAYEGLSFESMNDYEHLLDSLAFLSDAELLAWERNQPNFRSLYRIHSEVLDSICHISCVEDYENIVKDYQNILIFNYNDYFDFSVYLPTLDITKAITLNQFGEVQIAGEIIDMKDFKDYDEYLSRTSRKYSFTRTTIENGTNRVYVKTSDRSFSANYGIEFGRAGIRVNAKKKILFGWVEYTTAYFWRLSPNGPVYFGEEVKSGTDILLPAPYAEGTTLYMWTRGTKEENSGYMIIHNN